ncbi:DUF2079 domain-containing protein [Candidatus Microgenomates bacterium]|nr:DUF2079 domain-containing protein [Candidatus Microgenomates bacterium]
MLVKKHLGILLVFIFFFSIFTYHTLYRHWTYNSHAFDLGIYTQVIYLYSQGLTPLSTLKHMNILGDHFGVILFLLSPIYKLFPFPEALLVIQALFVSLSGIFIYLIALDKLKDKLKTILITGVYLSFSGILTAVNFDFHLATLSVLPLSIMLYSWYFKKWKLYFISLFLGLLFKEDVPLFIVGLGLFAILKKQRRLGVLTVIFGLLSYHIIKYQIMGRISPGAENAYINTVSFSSISSMFDSPTKIHTLKSLYGQFLFLPFLSLLSWLTIIPYLFIRFSSTQPHYWGLNFHYNANLAPFLATSAIFVLSKIQIPRYQMIAYLIVALTTENLFFNKFVSNTLQFNIQATQRFNYINNALQTFPTEAAISAQSPIVPHLSNRNKVYLYPEVLDADYIIVDEKLNHYPMKVNEFEDRIASIKTSSEWILEKQVNSLLIFRRVRS